MFPIPLRSSKSDRSLRKLKKGRSNLSWSTKSIKGHILKPEVDFAAFHSGLPGEDDRNHLESPTRLSTNPTPFRRPRCISIRNVKRETLLIDLTNNDLLPALDYAFAILDAEDASTRSLPPPSPLKPLSIGVPSCSSDTSSTPPSLSSFGTSIVSTPPRYYISSPLKNSTDQLPLPNMRNSRKCNIDPVLTSCEDSFDSHELSHSLLSTQSNENVDSPLAEPSLTPSVPFPPPASPPAARVPLLQRKPRHLHSPESSIDGHECFTSRSYPGSSKVSLARSVSSLDHHRDFFGSQGACPSSISVNTLDSGLAALLARNPASHAPSSLKLFSSQKKPRPHPARRASTPPPSRSRTRMYIPSAQPPVPALPDISLLGPAARREAVSDSNYFLSRSHK
ncbi:hypothetical protein K439DRAFT_1619326 [Ramaria rubella]|nr:hypothetical protein K439DRAFT_1619326 [Ramaria rubella]